MRNDPITLVVASELNRDFANGTLYLDDGESFAYQTESEYMYWSYTFKKENNYLYTITSKNLDKKGKYDPDVSSIWNVNSVKILTLILKILYQIDKLKVSKIAELVISVSSYECIFLISV